MIFKNEERLQQHGPNSIGSRLGGEHQGEPQKVRAAALRKVTVPCCHPVPFILSSFTRL